VVVKQADIKEAKKIVIAPAQKGIMVQGDPEQLKAGLLGRPVFKGDIVVIGGVQRRKDIMSDDNGMEDIFGNLNEMLGGMGFNGMGGGIQPIRFIIINTNPNTACIITEKTQLVLNNKAVDVAEESGIPQITYEDIGGLTDEVKKFKRWLKFH